MIDYHKELTAALESVLPTYYELFLHKGIETPCISYIETNNYTTDKCSEGIGYSIIVYQIKIWGKNIAELQEYAQKVDAKLKPLGFKRTSSNELIDTTGMIQKIMTYEALAREYY